VAAMGPPRETAQAGSLPLVVDRFVPRPFKNHLIVFASIVAALFALMSGVIAFFVREPWPYLGLCLPVSFGLVSVPFAFKFAHHRFIEWAQTVNTFLVTHGNDERTADKDKDVRQWVFGQLSFFGASIGMYMTGLILALWTLLAFYLGEYFSYLSGWPLAFICSLIALSAFVAGLGLYAIFGASRLIWRLGDGTYRILVKSHKFGILSTGRMLLECYFVIALVCMVYYLSAITGERSFLSDFKFWNPPVWMLVLPTSVFILGTFIICQIPLHKQMVMYKRDELTKVENRLDELKKRFEKNLTSKLRDEIKYHEERRLEILGLPEWPFGLRGILGAIGSSVTVVLPTVFSVILKIAGRSSLGIHE
jgi:hypothetical protein